MSAYGPAVFVARKDGAGIPVDEQEAVLALVRSAARTLRLADEEGRAAAPRVYDYDECEKGALGVLLHSGYSFGAMPEEVQEDQERLWADECGRVAAEIDRRAPGQYAVIGYGVED
jgi:hypothetical protein